VADLIYRVVDNHDDESVKSEVSERVDELTDEYTLYD
jgi:glycine hydroxymethyltransferase